MIKALEIISSTLFNLVCANSTICTCSLPFTLIIDLLWISTFTAQISNHIAKLVIPIGIPTKEVKAEMEMHPAIEEAKIRKCSILFRVV